MIDEMWIGKENLRMMPRCLIWTSEWIVTFFSEIKNTGTAAGLRVQNNEFSFGQVKFQDPRDIKLMSRRQLDVRSSVQEGCGLEERFGSHQHHVKGLSSGNSGESSKIHFVTYRPNKRPGNSVCKGYIFL